ncbi:MAG: hypothetical protein ABSF34_22375, partial [Verrucomicrobiota bacterium]
MTCSLPIVASDFPGFVNMTAQFGGAIRDGDLMCARARLLVDTMAVVELLRVKSCHGWPIVSSSSLHA